jgi:NodT family efflux transporter outer membrane factor (OMF) lipoprotein
VKRCLPHALALLCAGCAVGPDYQRPEGAIPEAWSALAGEQLSAESADLTRWWTVFGDPALDALIERACAANHDLEQATARLREARARAGVARAELWPEVDAAGGASRNRASENGALPPIGDPEYDLYSAGFDARWELDVFGGTRRAIEAAEADIGAALEDRRAVLVSLLGEVASAYVDLRGNQRLASVARDNIEASRSTLELTRTRRAAGLATELDVTRAEALLAGAQATLPGFEAEVRIAIHRLSVLLGEHPGSLAAELLPEAPIPAAPERILVGLPSELLTRRPDVRRAERELAAATARIGVAVAERYPRFSLSGAFGLESVSSSDFTEAASRAWSIGPALRWPVFAGGRILADIEVQEARAEQSLSAYEQALLIALEDVENAFVRTLREWNQRRSLEEAAAASRKSVELVDDAYTKGLSSFLDVLDAQRSSNEAELDLAQSQVSTALEVVALYKALGGGWESAQ